LANELLGSYQNKQGLICSTDDFFINPKTGIYSFYVQGLGKAHFYNQKKVEIAMEKGISPIIVDNTNLQAWEALPYAQLAEKFGYNVELKEPKTEWARNLDELTSRNKHGLKRDDISRMLKKIENYSVDEILKSKPPSLPKVDNEEKRKLEESLRKWVESNDKINIKKEKKRRNFN